MTSEQTAHGGPLRDFAAAAAWLGIPESTLRHKVANRVVPFTKIGRHVRFSDDHLRQIVAAGENRPAVQVSA